MRKIKVAAIQAMSLASDFSEKWQGADVEHALELLDQAAAKGADLACFPELYPLVGKEALCAKAKQHGMHVIAGLADGKPERWYNTSVIISPAGEIVGRQTKNYPTAGEIDNGVVPGDTFEVFETDIGRFGIVICADFAFFNDGVGKSRTDNADIIFNPAVWFALAEAYPHVVAGRHLEYSAPIFGVNLARPTKKRNDTRFPPAGGHSTVCIPPAVTNLDELWNWFCTKPGGIDGTADFIQSMGPGEEMMVVEVDIDAVRRFPGYFSTRVSERGKAAA
ncbi:MAG: carbon-nitrogen hydrolase family protein [Rhizobiaceae bacterium]|jgi:predicted amidohydrolase